MHPLPNSFRRPDDVQQPTLDELQVVLAQPTHLPRIGELLQAHHYLGFRRNRQGHYPAPSQSTFSRFLAGIDAAALEASLREVQT